jgi:hypothetical protein
MDGKAWLKDMVAGATAPRSWRRGARAAASGSCGSMAVVATRVARQPILDAHAYSRWLRGANVKIGVGVARGPIGGRWQQPAFHFRKVWGDSVAR